MITVAFSFLAVLATSCKSKKAVVVEEPPVAAPAPAPAPEPVKEADTDGDGIVDSKDNCPNEKGVSANNGCPEVVVKPFEYKNIQFEFNSSVLKTESYATLDAIASEIKKNAGKTYQLNGHSSAEGTDARNMALSVDRANAVKAYLVNTGIDGKTLVAKGFGETAPVAGNDTEADRSINRRVEIKPGM